MALSATAIGGITAGVGSLLGAGMNSYSSGKMNKKTLNWNREAMAMQQVQNFLNFQLQNKRYDEIWNRQNEYDTMLWHRQNQREDDIWHRQNAHNLEMWKLQNMYNSPAAQMERYKEAGLNPYLIYGQSNMGGTISTGAGGSGHQSSHGAGSGTLENAKFQSWNPTAPHFDFHSGIMAMAAFREQSARTNNLEKQNEVLNEEKGLKAAQKSKYLADAANVTFDLGLKKTLENISVDAAKEALRQKTIQNDLALKAEARAVITHSSSMLEAARRIALMEQEVLTKQQEYELRKFDFQLREAGIHQDSPGWLKAGAHFMQSQGIGVTDLIKYPFGVLGKGIGKGINWYKQNFGK